ncbi:MAG: hypothetical protein II304_05270 [Bacteroidales bacterium]|nr:hypothetical protein [Bacteroidales bacterium]
MYVVDLQNIPNQEFTFVVESKIFRVQLRTIQDMTFASIFLNSEPLLYSQLCTPNNFINLYKYISAGGKFYFECVDNEYPYYEKFGSTQRLLFYTEDEL